MPDHCYYKINCYATQSRLFIAGGEETLSNEGTTQGDPTAMEAYALGILPLIKFLPQSYQFKPNEC